MSSEPLTATGAAATPSSVDRREIRTDPHPHSHLHPRQDERAANRRRHGLKQCSRGLRCFAIRVREIGFLRTIITARTGGRHCPEYLSVSAIRGSAIGTEFWDTLGGFETRYQDDTAPSRYRAFSRRAPRHSIGRLPRNLRCRRHRFPTLPSNGRLRLRGKRPIE